MEIDMSKSSWELINSWWLILPFTFPLYLNWTAFIYVGITARHRKWILYGVIYAIPSMLLTFIGSTANSNEIIDANSTIGILIIIIYLMGCTSIIHAFSLREEYLIRLKALKNVKNDDKLRKKIAREYGLGDRVSSDTQEHSTIIKDEKQAVSDGSVKDFPPTVSPLTDINNDPEDLLLELPGINETLAKKIIQLRRSGIYFDSAEDFGESLSLKPHVVERIKPLIVINPSREEIKIMKNKGRIVDI
jgi:DNA uptake protein ComE-like DNA-binding protein